VRGITDVLEEHPTRKTSRALLKLNVSTFSTEVSYNHPSQDTSMGRYSINPITLGKDGVPTVIHEELSYRSHPTYVGCWELID